MTHVVELWIARPFTVYVDDPNNSMSEDEIKDQAVKQAVDSEDNLTPVEGIDIEEQDVTSFDHQDDLPD